MQSETLNIQNFLLQSRKHLSLPQFDSVSSLCESGVLVVEATQPLVKDLKEVKYWNNKTTSLGHSTKPDYIS